MTSDKDILFYVNRFSARTMTSEKFADQVTRVLREEEEARDLPEKEDDPVVSDEEVSFWERLFGRKERR